MLKVNDSVKWTSSDAEGTFTHIGTVAAIDKASITLQTDEGTITTSLDDGTFAKTKATAKRVAFKPYQPDPNVSVPSSLKPGTVKYKVYQLLKGKDVSRQRAIDMIVAAGLSTPKGASTHYSNVKSML